VGYIVWLEQGVWVAIATLTANCNPSVYVWSLCPLLVSHEKFGRLLLLNDIKGSSHSMARRMFVWYARHEAEMDLQSLLTLSAAARCAVLITYRPEHATAGAEQIFTQKHFMPFISF
jgi:hypothetical protein